MLDTLARPIAETAGDTLGRKAGRRGAATITDEAIGAHLWFERGFRDHDIRVQLINHTRHILDSRAPPPPAQPPYYCKPVQLGLDLRAA